jgi:hypothetical protein
MLFELGIFNLGKMEPNQGSTVDDPTLVFVSWPITESGLYEDTVMIQNPHVWPCLVFF